MKNLKQSKHLTIFYLFLSFIILINLPTIISLLWILINFYQWNEKTLIAVILIYLFYKKIKATTWQFQPTYRTRYLQLAIIINVLGILSNTNAILWLGFALSIYSLLVYFFGYHQAKEFVILLALMLFVGKINSPTALHLLSFHLRLISTKIAAVLLNLFTIGTTTQGTYLITQNITCSIDNACSGLNNLTSLTFLTLVYCYYQNSKLVKTAVLTILATILAIVANTLRITLLTTIGHFFGTTAIAPDTLLHSLSGIVLFLLALFLVYKSAQKISK